MSEEIKNQQAAEPEALTETEINEQMQVRINKMHQIEEKGWKPFGHKFEWTHHAQDIADQFEELTANETVVRLSWPRYGYPRSWQNLLYRSDG